jgi:hypothetical protein
MWTYGYLNDKIAYEAKIYKNRSAWSIGNSRASKLYVYRTSDGECFYSNERGSISGSIEPSMLNAILERLS